MSKFYRFKIKDESDSIEHQDLFFKLGYTWFGGKTKYEWTHANYLYLESNRGRKNIMWSDGLGDISNDIECKMLQPKQLEFLKKFAHDKDIAEIISNGYYEVSQSENLNKMRKVAKGYGI